MHIYGRQENWWCLFGYLIRSFSSNRKFNQFVYMLRFSLVFSFSMSISQLVAQLWWIYIFLYICVLPSVSLWYYCYLRARFSSSIFLCVCSFLAMTAKTITNMPQWSHLTHMRDFFMLISIVLVKSEDR